MRRLDFMRHMEARVRDVCKGRRFRQGITAGALILFATCILTLSYQGFGGRITCEDQVPYLNQVERLFAEGRLPEHGCVNSLACFHPPSACWPLVPGRLFSRNPVLVFVPATALLFLLAILAVYAIGIELGGGQCAWLAVIVYGLSAVGFETASSYFEPYPHALYLGFAYAVMRWVRERRPVFLSLALSIAIVGLTFHLQGIVLLTVLPAVWCVWRPPLVGRSLWGVLVVGMVVWGPYLRFEHHRAYADIVNQVRLQHQLYTAENLPRAHALVPDVFREPAAAAPAVIQGPNRLQRWLVDGANEIHRRALALPGVLASNVRPATLPRLAVILIVGIIVAQIAHLLRPLLPRFLDHWRPAADRGASCLDWLAVVGVVSATALMPPVVSGLLGKTELASYTVNTLNVVRVGLAGAGVIVLARRLMADWLGRLPRGEPDVGTVFALCLALPWGAMVLMTDTPYRFTFLWPAQVLMLALFMCRWTWPALAMPGARRAGIGVVMVLLCLHAPLTKLFHWQVEGWRGGSAERRTIDKLGRALAGTGTTSVSIGYCMIFMPWVPAYSLIDPTYKIGMGYDWYLRQQYGVTNQNTTPLACSDRDTYLVVSQEPARPGRVAPQPRSLDGWTRLYVDPPYELWWRPGEGASAHPGRVAEP